MEKEFDDIDESEDRFANISILEQLSKKLESGTCTPLEIFNIKMFASFQALDVERRVKIFEQMYKDETEFDRYGYPIKK